MFLDALEAEVHGMPQGFAPETVFIGGGTPTELSDSDFERLLGIIRRGTDARCIAEWTCESNPGTLTREKARMMMEHGVNRVSVGVQSFDEKNLEFLGRVHSGEDAREAVDILRDAGLTNLNLDLMFGIPGSSEETLLRDLRGMIELSPAHASCYCLTFESGTGLEDLRKQGYVQEMSGEDTRRQYQIVRKTLNDAGYSQYEISNFSRPGFQCLHNRLYWGSGQYIGIGPSAASNWRGARYENVKSIRKYCERLLAGHSARSLEERLDSRAKAREALVFSLRRTDGVSTTRFFHDTGFEIEALCGAPLEMLENEGYLEREGDRLRLTDKGLFVSDAVFSELI